MSASPAVGSSPLHASNSPVTSAVSAMFSQRHCIAGMRPFGRGLRVSLINPLSKGDVMRNKYPFYRLAVVALAAAALPAGAPVSGEMITGPGTIWVTERTSGSSTVAAIDAATGEALGITPDRKSTRLNSSH